MPEAIKEPWRCWYCANWKANPDDVCSICGNSGKEKPNGYATGYRKQTGNAF